MSINHGGFTMKSSFLPSEFNLPWIGGIMGSLEGVARYAKELWADCACYVENGAVLLKSFVAEKFKAISDETSMLLSSLFYDSFFNEPEEDYSLAISAAEVFMTFLNITEVFLTILIFFENAKKSIQASVCCEKDPVNDDETSFIFEGAY